MVSFDSFRESGNDPIYIQLATYIKHGIVAGIIKVDDELPSRRVVSATLGINPNTVQKAYKLLEDEEIISSKAGAGSHVTLSKKKLREIKKSLMENNAREMVMSLKDMGITREEAVDMIVRLWGGEE